MLGLCFGVVLDEKKWVQKCFFEHQKEQTSHQLSIVHKGVCIEAWKIIGCETLTHPPNSPDLNLIENI